MTLDELRELWNGVVIPGRFMISWPIVFLLDGACIGD
jgi:hypothetical protein